MSLDNFRPVPQGTVSGAVLASITNITITKPSPAYLLTNVGTVTIFWKSGTGGASITADTPLAAGQSMVVSLPFSETVISVIAAGTGSTLYVTPGTGAI